MAREVIYRGRKIDVAVETLTLPDGATVKREMVLHPGAVVILPLVDAEHVCLLRNQRFVVGETLLELPAGTLEPGEDPEKAGIRELAEETGYRAARWRKLAEFFASPGIMNERMHLYLAEGLTAGPTQLEQGEDLEAQTVPWNDAVAWAMNGTIRDGKTLVGILLWDRLRRGS